MTPEVDVSRETVPRLWPGETVVCLGTGPSLTYADLTACRGQARIIAINDAYKVAPWADVLYAADQKWWGWHQGCPGFAGRKYSLAPTRVAGVVSLRNTGRQGLEADPGALKTGHCSGYQAINLAVHLGAARIVLLGYDLQGDHYFGSHPDKTAPPFALCLGSFPALVEPLAAAGISVVNCSRATALRCFPLGTLATALPGVAV